MKPKTEVILDLTKPLDSSLEIYVEDNYRDPDFSCIEWSSVEKQGYRVSALSLGTQTGTHIDAPAHFDSSGNCLDALALENLIGPYFLLDLPQDTSDDQAKTLCDAYSEEAILFVRSDHSSVSFITRDALDVLLKLPPIVWVVTGQVELTKGAPLEFHRLLACHGKYLIENVHAELASAVRPGGELIALPLRLVGTSGSPCRVVIRQSSIM
jgi:arylformamidase